MLRLCQIRQQKDNLFTNRHLNFLTWHVSFNYLLQNPATQTSFHRLQWRKNTISISISTDTHHPQKAYQMDQMVMYWGFKSNLNLTVFSWHALCDVLCKCQLNGQTTNNTLLLNSPL